MPRYIFRYFFGPGSGICLWSANDEARDRFDYPVQLTDLGLSENLLAMFREALGPEFEIRDESS
jgi:hypothetical protein